VNWHTRFTQQATWTHDLRQYLYQRAGLNNARRVLDVGCGSGALLDELSSRSPYVHGVDKERSHLQLATRHEASISCADAHHLPYPCNTFDITLCHFVLLWVSDPRQVLSEMTRVTRPGGVVLALAEPDYGGRIDYPEMLAVLGDLQNQSLRQQGADPFIGRKLAHLLRQAGLEDAETGALGGQWPVSPTPQDEWGLEWQVLEDDLKQAPNTTPDFDLKYLFEIESQARQNGERILFVPTFWGFGKKPDM
jgi:SAM-dependent methyltransferase